MTDKAEQLLLDSDLDIDQRATANRVRHFLDFNFERYLNFAGLNASDLSVIDDSHLSSPKMDASGVSAHGGINHTEQSFDRIMEAEKACKAIYQTIKNCRNGERTPYQTILTEKYLRYTSDQNIQVLLGYSPSRYDILKRRALCEFADRFDKWKEYYGVDYLDDLHVPRKSKKDMGGQSQGDSKDIERR